LQYNGDITADVWYGDHNNPLTLLPENTGLLYQRNHFATYKIIDRPDLPVIPTVEFSIIPDITDTDYIEITLTFNTAPIPEFTLGDLTYDINNGTISNLQATADDRVWTFRYTANADIDDATNTITAGTNYYDAYDNKATTPVVSNNFSINTTTEVRIETNGDFVTDDGWTIYISPSETGTITHDEPNQRFYFNNIITNSGIRQMLTLEAPEDYDIEFQISGYNIGSITSRIEGQDPTYIYRSANGVFNQTITNDPNTEEEVWIQGYFGLGFTGYIEYIKIVKV